MNNFGFCRVGAAIPRVKVGDCEYNVNQITALLRKAEEQHVEIVCFPELSVTAYTCGDLFLHDVIISEAEKAVAGLLKETAMLSVCYIIGAPVSVNSKLYNCALVCHRGKLLGIVPKTYLPNYSEFYEKRWFNSYAGTEPHRLNYAGQTVSFSTNLLFGSTGKAFAVEICEDVWSVIPPSFRHSLAGAQLIFNLSASDELVGKHSYVKSLLAQQSARCNAAYVYAAAGFGESTTDVVYSGNAYVYENGKLLSEAARFQLEEQLIIGEVDLELIDSERRKNTTFTPTGNESDYERIDYDATPDQPFRLTRTYNPHPFIPDAADYEEIFNIQVAGLAKRITHINTKSLVIGVSGGLDSTLALLVCIKTVDLLGLPRTMICGVTMPGFGTTGRTYHNAIDLMKSLGITVREISIVPATEQHFKDIDHDPTLHNVTYENAQARERTKILMDIANQVEGIVVGTGDMSELALGWATYNGDHMSMYAVNSGIPKTLVRHLVKWVALHHMEEASRATLLDIVDTPISPELLPADASGEICQITEDLVGPYELHDFFLYYTLRYGFSPKKIFFLAKHAFATLYEEKAILKWLEVFFKRFFSQQFKRSCIPDGPKVGSVNLSPRGDWRMPSDASVNLWLKEIDELK